MYSTRFNGRPRDNGIHDQIDTAPSGSMTPLITSLQALQPKNIRRQKEKEKKGIPIQLDSHGINILYYIHCLLDWTTLIFEWK
jgi:hypothetical protein